MAEKNLKARIVHKHDIEANWLLAANFTPKQGEIIVYDIDDNYSYERFKIGDGVQNVNDLPFADDILREELTILINAVDDKVDAVSTLVGDTAVSEQINSALDSHEISWNDLKDRPFYEDTNKVYTVVHEESFTAQSNGIYSAPSNLGMWPGNAYRVTLNDEVFDNVTTDNWSSFDFGSYTYEFSIAEGEYYYLKGLTPNAEYTLKVEEITEEAVVVQIDEKFIPDSIANMIYVGPDMPTDPNIKVWINTSEEGTGVIPVLPRIATITLAAANWTGSSSPYSQVVEIATVTTATKIDLQPTVAQMVSLQNDDIALMAENDNGVVTIYSFGGKPSSDMTMQVQLMEVSYV